jgi:hypothetical protein
MGEGRQNCINNLDLRPVEGYRSRLFSNSHKDKDQGPWERCNECVSSGWVSLFTPCSVYCVSLLREWRYIILTSHNWSLMDW